MTIKIPLRKSERVTLVSDQDAHLAEHTWSWHARLGVVRYDATRYNPQMGRTPQVLMARTITNASSKWFVVHLDGNHLNNQRDNLLLLEPAQYAQYVNKKLGKSEVLGASQHRGGFEVHIQAQYIGRFRTAKEAARAYDREAIQRFGPSARLNFPRSFRVCHECHRAHFKLATDTTCAACLAREDTET